jgi:cytochrome c-type biogenesis protein CcmH/NrfF
MKAPSRAKYQAAKNKKTAPKPYKRSGSYGRGSRSKVIGYSSLAVIVLLVGGILLLTLQPKAQPGNTGNGSSIVWAADVQRIASNFNCPCGQCGIARLDTCTCDIAGGANEAKSYIQYLLNQGLPDNEVITGVEERYGNRIL